MKSITSAIRPRRRRSTNASSASLPKQQSTATMQRRPQKFSSVDEPPSYLGRSLTQGSGGSGSSSIANAATNVKGIDSTESLSRRETAETENNEPPFSENGDYVEDQSSMRRSNAGTASVPYPLYCESIKEDPREASALVSELEPSAVQAVDATANNVPRSRISSYLNRLPLHIFGIRRPSPRAALNNCDRQSQWSEDKSWTDSIPGAQSVMSLNHNAGFFGGGDNSGSEPSLLKRVSSVPGNLSLFRAHLTDPLLHPEFRAPPRYTRHQPIRLPVHEPDDTPIYGYMLLGLTSVLFISTMYALVVSKFMPETGIAFLDAVKDDHYFCLLMPITGLSFVFAVFWNWLGMKFFRHSH
ncbi:hypothetical protein IWW36_004621 [Coemansia brasiliensis]|uniref:Uncharacterized protein n=1 Tax=Coemansia brasiliensis TaxID=2650707 RepID=A0A9W8IBT5_9FUNG|nr:hypothetical protein IWW36_004621 [Coemansia brasiliensis]